ncbi:MAG: nitroreductase [Firmicutes bacterium]|nr:nitroreductase [Bacillota bacterium]
MTLKEAIEARHSVRAYTDEKIPEDIRKILDEAVSEANEEGRLHISIRYDDPEGFDSKLAHYGNFRNVRNFIVLAGKKDDGFDLRCGYYGEKLVILAQTLGLNTCWAALTFNKKKVKELLAPGESLCMVIALGYGETQGRPHRGKSFLDVCESSSAPAWFRDGIEAALLAPTAVNQQKFFFSRDGEKAVLRSKGIGSCLQTDLGIVKYHFETASGHEVEVK